MRGLTVWILKNGGGTFSYVSLNLLLKNDIAFSPSKVFPPLFKGQLTALENFSQHTQIAALMAEIGMDEQGLALTMVRDGPYLQVTSLFEKSSAANDGKLKPGKKNQ